MGFIDFLKKKHDFASEFKAAFENEEYEKIAPIFNDWTKSGDKDANYYYAMALMYSRTVGKSLDDAYNEFEKAERLTPNDESLKPWFKSVSWKFVKMKADEEGKLKTLYI